ncbi:MAG TPA: 3-phosphoshikimate 1-carboxyvinyltransferase, partial [Saprospiraceae bacterium]|nr:3-phosphoshikimate 1-carboxyvinyltransferase [Saprospiraceae bacterium]
MPRIRISHPTGRLHASLRLEGSKSISNRALIALALCDADPEAWLSGLSDAQDTLTLRRLLAQPSAQPYDAGDAGTTFRFLTAYLSTRPDTQLLTGSARMLQRPIGPLVEALRTLGADIEYLGESGYPPLRIGPPRYSLSGGRRSLPVSASTSSQFLSALLLIGPYLPGGLELVPEGHLVSRPYVDMTLHLMRHFGAEAYWAGERLVVEAGGYMPRPLRVEADWSAASYWYAMAVLCESADLRLAGLFAESWQGDAAIAALMERQFGIQTAYEADGIRLSKSGAPMRPVLEYDFLDCPDLVQTVAVLCAACGVQGLFSGLDTLALKETDRVAALRTEL